MVKFAQDNGLSLRQNYNREAPRLAVGSMATMNLIDVNNGAVLEQQLAQLRRGVPAGR